MMLDSVFSSILLPLFCGVPKNNPRSDNVPPIFLAVEANILLNPCGPVHFNKAGPYSSGMQNHTWHLNSLRDPDRLNSDMNKRVSLILSAHHLITS